jgi:hypothetical protein
MDLNYRPLSAKKESIWAKVTTVMTVFTFVSLAGVNVCLALLYKEFGSLHVTVDIFKSLNKTQLNGAVTCLEKVLEKMCKG